MMAVAVELRDFTDHSAVLSDGEERVLGRKDFECLRDELLISRNQFKVAVHDGVVTLSSLGANPTYLHRLGSRRKALRKGASAVVHDGDRISLLESQFFFTVHVQSTISSYPKDETEGDATQAQMDTTDELEIARRTAHLHNVVSPGPSPGASPDLRQTRAGSPHLSPSPPRSPPNANNGDDGAPQGGRGAARRPSPALEQAAAAGAGGGRKRERVSPDIDRVSPDPKRARVVLDHTSLPPSPQSSSLILPQHTHFVIAPSELKIKKVIGRGSCGEVSKGEWHCTPVAIKKVFRSLLQADVLKEFLAETDILMQLRHPNVVLFLGCCHDPANNSLSIVTEFMERGSLSDVLADKSIQIDTPLLLRFATDAALGMNYLHNHKPPIIHRDLKSANLLVDRYFNVKVSDFGLAKKGFAGLARANTFCGTIPWLAPEVFAEKGYTEKADIYSYAITVWEMVARAEPFVGMSPQQIMIEVGTNGVRPPIPATCPAELARIIVACWAAEPAARPTFAQIVRALTEAAQAHRPHPTCPTSATSSPVAAAAGALPIEGDAQEIARRFSEQQQQDGPLPHDWQISCREVHLLDVLSNGDSSVVYRAHFRSQDVAVKIFKGATDENIQTFTQEVGVISKVRLPCTAYFFGAGLEPRPFIVTELMAHGSIYDVMQTPGPHFTYDLVRRLAAQGSKAMLALHSWSPPVLHRDCKSSNFLVGENWDVKICDFGLARFDTASNRSTMNKVRGSLVYAAPETYDSRFTTKSDVYSFGIVLWEMINRALTSHYAAPYSDHQFSHEFQIVFKVAKDNLRPTIPPHCPQVAVELLNMCWASDPEQRPSFGDLLVLLRSL